MEKQPDLAKLIHCVWVNLDDSSQELQMLRGRTTLTLIDIFHSELKQLLITTFEEKKTH